MQAIEIQEVEKSFRTVKALGKITLKIAVNSIASGSKRLCVFAVFLATFQQPCRSPLPLMSSLRSELSLSRLSPGATLFYDPLAPRIAFLNPNWNGPFIEFRRLEQRGIETRLGEMWRVRPSKGPKGLRVLEVKAPWDGYLPHYRWEVCHGEEPPCERPDERTYAMAQDCLGLYTDRKMGLVRFAWNWWVPLISGSRFLLWRSKDFTQHWIILKQTSAGDCLEISAREPVAINPMGQGLRFVFEEEEWDLFRQLTRGIWLLSHQGSLGDKSPPDKWMAVVRSKDGSWDRLRPNIKRLPCRSNPLIFGAKRWRLLETWVGHYERDGRGRISSCLVFWIEYENGPVIRIALPLGRRGPPLPSLKTVANDLGRLPLRMLTDHVSLLEVHSEPFKGLFGDYDRDKKRVRLFPPFRERYSTIVHEAIGHGLYPHTKAFEALWVGAMLADGTGIDASANDVEEDFAWSVEYYLMGHWARYPVRFALLDRLLHPDGSSITEEETRKALALFRVKAGRLTMNLR